VYSRADAQYEDPSDTPWLLTLPEKALMVVRPTENGDSMTTLKIWLQIVRDNGAKRNKDWKSPTFATLPGNSKFFFVYDTTAEAEKALIQARIDIQKQFLGPNDVGASAMLIHLATFEARGTDTSVLRSYSTEGAKEEAQLRYIMEALESKYSYIEQNDPYAKKVAGFATQNQQATNKEETDKTAHKEKEDEDALEHQAREAEDRRGQHFQRKEEAI